MIRIYTKPKGQIPDYEEPVILHAEAPTVRDFCNRLHKSIVNQFQYAWVWGSSVKHQPQRVGLDHVLMDEDVVQMAELAITIEINVLTVVFVVVDANTK